MHSRYGMTGTSDQGQAGADGAGDRARQTLYWRPYRVQVNAKGHTMARVCIFWAYVECACLVLADQTHDPDDLVM